MKQRLTSNSLYIQIFTLLCCFPLSFAHAIDRPPPAPVHRDDVFKGLQLDIEQQQEHAAALLVEQKKERAALEKLERQTIPLGKSIQTVEQELLRIAADITSNESEQSVLEETLQENQHLLSDGLLGALRMRRTPTESLLIQTASPLHTAQTALILERTLPQVKKRMDLLSLAVNRLATLRQQLSEQKKKQSAKLAELQQEQQKIERLILARQELIKTMQKDYKTAEQAAKRLSRDAATLKDLVKKVRAQNEVIPPRPRPKPAQNNNTAQQVALVPSPPRPPTKPSGASSYGMPVAGTVKIAYGQPDKYGATTQGVEIQTRQNALVTAPMEGTVRFAGTFKNYGEMIIIEHAGGWHSMIARLGKINAIVGQSVKSGEPIGSMTSQNASDSLLLYYELRYNGAPVNPAKKIKSLKS